MPVTQQEISHLLDQLEARGLSAGDISKAFTQATGLTYYDLQTQVQRVYPLVTPLIKWIPRKKGNGGTGTNWKAIKKLDNSGALGFVGEGNRGALMNTPVTNYYRPYKTIGVDTRTSFEAQAASEGLDESAKETATILLLDQARQAEEWMVLGGNSADAGTGVALGTTPTPTVTANNASGSLAAQTWSVIVVAMSYHAWVASRGTIVTGSALPLAASRTNADSSTDAIAGGLGAKSAAATQATTGGASSLNISWAAVSGAFAYGIYVGAAGSETLQAITVINSAIVSSIVAGTQAASALPAGTDNSRESLAFDGILYQIIASGSSIVTQLPTGTIGSGTPLTSDGNRGITEFNNIFQQMWAAGRICPGQIWLSGNRMNAVQKLIGASGNGNAQAFLTPDANGQLSTMGVYVSFVLNNYAGGRKVQLMVHPDLPDSVALFTTNVINTPEYPTTNLSSLLEIKTRREWYQIDYPQNSRKYESGVYAEELLAIKNYPHFALITNIGG